MLDVDLTDHTALVTGSATGVGAEIGKYLARVGATVAVNYRSSEDEAIEVVEEIRESDGNAIAVQADVTEPGDVENAFDEIERRIGTVDVLVNNVGAFEPTHWRDMPIETWNRIIDSNLTSTYLCTRRALQPMVDADWGRIVNIGYAAADRGMINPKNAPYFISKTGVAMFTRMVAADVADRPITVNAIAPYVIEDSETFPEDLPGDRPARFDDVVNGVVFFLRPENDYVSGQHLGIDGGWLPERV